MLLSVCIVFASFAVSCVPLQFCADMWLMFDNAWLYNKKTSRVYKFCTKLSEVFDQHINAAMIQLGYCCGMRVSMFAYTQFTCTLPTFKHLSAYNVVSVLSTSLTLSPLVPTIVGMDSEYIQKIIAGLLFAT